MKQQRKIYIIISFMALFILQWMSVYPSPIKWELSSEKIPQGGISIIKIMCSENLRPQIVWMKKQIPVEMGRKKGTWFGLLSADIQTIPGKYYAELGFAPENLKQKIPLVVRAKDYGVRRLTLPDKMVRLTGKDLERVKRESARLKALWSLPPSPPLWQGEFELPLKGEIIGSFGKKSIINGLPRSPHSGIDMRAQMGTPVRAVNSGRVILSDNLFFSGKSIIIDHGAWIFSMYFHLSGTIVKKGSLVRKGQVIGYSGASGRATGPHLHFGLRVNGSRVDPLLFIELTKRLKYY